MIRLKFFARLLMCSAVLAASPLFAQHETAFNNTWEIIPPMSPNVNRYTNRLSLQFETSDGQVTLIRNWGRRSDSGDTLTFTPDGSEFRVPVTDRNTLSTYYSALIAKHGTDRVFSATWTDSGRTLQLKQSYQVDLAQGSKTVNEIHRFTIARRHDLLTYTIERDSRAEQPTATYVLKIKDSMRSYMMELEDNWEVQGDLQRQALLISLQGLANRDGANLYLIYPESWQFTYTRRLYEWYRDDRGYSFTMLKTPRQAIEALRNHVKGYVVWDKKVRTSLIVAYTVSGLKDAVVATEEQIPMLDSLGLKKIADFRGTFAGMSDADIYSWAKKQYWQDCSRKFIIWLGGHSGRVMLPGVADWGVRNKVFFQDLSTAPEDTAEIELAKELLGDMRSDALVMGWHSYAKDGESQHVTLCSSFGLPVLGLHSNPNISFENQIGFSEGFEFKNNHNIEPGKSYKPENKVYIANIQTDGIGIGAWLMPGRGEIPYAWETLMNYSWLAPSLLEFFYATATPNDYFIGALSGPGYIYPKAVPEDKLPGLLRRADSLMKRLDLHVFDIMDYSRTSPRHEFADLTQRVVDAYYENMPDAIGFVNGYVPANTNYLKDGRPMVSFQYYLSPTVSEQEAVNDLLELGRLNNKRPYFLLLHIRETSSVSRVKSILGQLPDEYELVPLDVFLKMAGQSKTNVNRVIQQ